MIEHKESWTILFKNSIRIEVNKKLMHILINMLPKGKKACFKLLQEDQHSKNKN